ncbi:MAG: thioredoxin family protein [bacterium]|nr:thioredoxin family protein [bacterium]
MEKLTSIEAFEEKLGATEYVLLDFSSPGCAPCKKVPPLLEEVLADLADTDIAAYEVDIVENIDIAQKYMVMGVPTIIVFKGGKDVKRFNSVPKKAKLLKVIT